jgi:Beta-ketoacyl synthase, N-terminal domain
MTMAALTMEILAASFFATHFASAEQALAGSARDYTAPGFGLLVGRARRFTSLVTQLHIEVLGALPAPTARRPAVFATCHGEIQTAHRLICEFSGTSEVSSAHFAQSVHNTPSGLYSVATGNTAPSTTVTGANAIAAGWLEAALIARETGGPVVLSIADEPVPPAFGGPAEDVGVAAAFLVGPAAAKPAWLAFEDRRDAPVERPLSLLARIVHVVATRGSGTIMLGSVLAGGTLGLHIPPEAAAL